MSIRIAGVMLAVVGAWGVLLAGAADPDIVFTSVPALGSFDNLSGHVTYADPAAYRVAVYVFVAEAGGWWNKPGFGEVVSFGQDGTWTVDVTTGGADQNATKLAALLIPVTYTPPDLSGAPAFPAPLLDAAVAQEAIYRHPLGDTRLVYFSGYEWWVKHRTSPEGPGPNLFSNSHESVLIDRDGRLHLAITGSGSTWQCSEIVSTASFGYGTYIFRLASPVDQLDRNTVVGLFTWSDQPDYAHREIDIEFSRWTDPGQDEAQFVLQPWDWAGHIERFALGDAHVPSAHGFTWRNGSIDWRSVRGAAYFQPEPGAVIRDWSYSAGDVPVPGDENARINFWLINGLAPTDGQPAAVILDAFQHVALGNESDGTVSGTITSNLPVDRIREGEVLRLTAPSNASTYQWYRNGAAVATNGRVTGADAQTLVFEGVQFDDQGSYTCAYDMGGAKQWVQTTPFVLDVLPASTVPATSLIGAIVTMAALVAMARQRMNCKARTDTDSITHLVST